VQKQADLVRLNATLVDGRQGRHIWAERYERRLEDVFGVQDELVQTIVGKMAIQINAAETAKVWRKPPQAYSAYEYLLKGRFLYRQRTRPANFEARQLYRKALDIAPRDVEAMVGLGWTYIREMYDGWSEFPNRAISKAQELAHGALAVDETSAGAHELLAECYLNRRQFKLAMAELDRSLELNPNAAHSLKAYGSLLFYRGDTGRSIRMFERALRLDPHLLTTSRSIYMELGLSHYLEENYADALHILNQGVSRRPDFAGNHIGLAATHAQLGDMAQARHHAEVVRKQLPFFNLNAYGTKFMQAEDRARIVAGLEKAGL
jgi:adenylate cyclase